jgi:PAS domain S-box-containing protein
MAVEKRMDRKKTYGATGVSRRGPSLPWPLLAVNFTLMAFILVGGYVYTRRQISQIQIDKKNELRAIAALKTSQIRHWLDEILDDGRFLRSSINSNAAFMKKLKIKPAAFQKIVTTWTIALKDFEEFAEIRFLDLQGRPIWPAAGESGPADPALARELQTAFASSEVTLSDLNFSPILKRINMSLQVPVFTFSATGRELPAMLLLSVDPIRFLFPLIQSWPTASPSAETLLVRREGEEVVYLNELRHRKNTALHLRAPIKKNETPAARAARGEVGFVAGPDYRGVQVLADIQRIPGTSWSLIAKIDQKEVRLLVARQEWVLLALVSMVFLLVAISTAYFWRKQQVGSLRRQVTSDDALQKSESRYRLLVENASEAIVISQDGFLKFVNPKMTELTSYPEAELTARPFTEFIHPGDRAFVVNIHQKRLRGEPVPAAYEFRYLTSDGQTRWFYNSAVITEWQGKPATFNFLMDVTDRKKSDDTLRQSEERYRLLIENQGEGIGLVNTEDRFIFANPAAGELFGVEPGDLAGRSLQEFVSAADFEKIRNKTVARSEIGKESYELKIIRPDGGERILHVTVTPRFDESGQFSGSFGIFRDISERKRDEEKIRRMLAEKELLLKEVHHRVKNNLMVIAALLQIQAQRVSDPKTLTVLQESQNRIHAMMTIYEKLYRATDLTHIGLGDYFSELTKSLFTAYNVRPGMIELETAISDIALDIDRTIPCGLIINELVSNTLKYAFPGDRQGRIRIEFCEITADNGRGTACRARTEEPNRAPLYALTVANNGVPLPAGFDITNSTGFGLQLVNMLASQLGGSVTASSGTGTEFRVVFPMNQAK